MRLTQREFRRLVRQALQELPSEIRHALENLAILEEDWPSGDDLEAAEIEDRHHLFGLYTGVPLSEREGGLSPLPDTIILFRRPIELACASQKEVIHEIRLPFCTRWATI